MQLYAQAFALQCTWHGPFLWDFTTPTYVSVFKQLLTSMWAVSRPLCNCSRQEVGDSMSDYVAYVTYASCTIRQRWANDISTYTAICMYVCTCVCIWVATYMCVNGHNQQVRNGQTLTVLLWVSIPHTHTHTFFTYKPTALNAAPWNVNWDRLAIGAATRRWQQQWYFNKMPCLITVW